MQQKPEHSLQVLIAEADLRIRCGDSSTAVRLLQRALELDPNHVKVHLMLAQLAAKRGEQAVLETHLARVVSVDPNQIEASNNLGIVYWTSGRSRQAVELLTETVRRAPHYAPAWFNLGNAQLQLHDYPAAIESYESAIKINPKYQNAWINLARACRLTLRYDRALQCLEVASELAPSPQAVSNWLFSAMFLPTIPASEIAARATGWASNFAANLAKPEPLMTEHVASRPLRIGYVCPNFRRHAIGWLIEPILAGHDRRWFHVFCYSDVVSPDEVTERIRSLDVVYRETRRLNDEQLAELVRSDRIDVLVDLNLHMAGCRLLAFARRPARLQVNYLAYPFTSGLSAMDVRVTDTILDPSDGPRFGPEALIKLQHSFWLYRPDPDSPSPAAFLPASVNGYFTFASLNNPRKLNQQLAACWARIMGQVPGSRLVLLTEDLATQAPLLQAIFASEGVDTGRIRFIPKESRLEHLRRYQQVDLCLDPFPYGGHTTALDATWMGVPTITLAGNSPYTRGATSILARVGLSHLSVASQEEYEAVAVKLAGNRDQFIQLRAGLREKMLDSVLCDETGFVSEFEAAIALAWSRA